MSYHSTAAITSLLGTTTQVGGGLRITQAGNQRIDQASNRRITQGGTAEGTIVTATLSIAGSAALTVAGASTSAITGLIAHWAFDETSGTNVADSADSHPGTTAGSPTFEAARIDNGIRLDGGGTQYIDFGDISQFLGLGRSYACWCYFDSALGFHAIFSKITADGSDGILLEQSGTSMMVYIDSGTQKIGAASFVTTAQWTHVAVVLDNASGPPYTVRLYKNGVQVDTGSYTTVGGADGLVAGQNFLIGRQNTFTGRDFDGVIDDFRIYDYPLLPSEVATLAAVGGGSVGPIEAINGSADQVAIAVGTTTRQTWDGFGWGAGAPSDVPSLTPYVDNSPNVTRLFADLGTRVLRLVDPTYPDFVTIHKPLVDICVANDVDRIMALGFMASGGYSATTLANAVDAAMTAGIPFTHVNLQNEPDGNPGNTMTPAEIVAGVQELRARLNTLGRSAVKITGCEWAKFSQGNLSEFDALNAAGLIPGTVVTGAGHCYKGCPTNQDYDDRYFTLASTRVTGLWSGETGGGGVPHTGARFVSGLNHGLSVEVHHAGQSPFAGNIQCLVNPDGSVMPQWGQYRIMTPLLTAGTIFRLCTSNDAPAGLSAIAAQRMLRTFGSYNPRINTACAKRPDGRWVFIAVNTTQGAGEVSNFLSAHYPGALIQVTATIPELSGVNAVWTTQRCSSAGTVTTGATINMQSGVMRFTLDEAESISLLSP